MEPERIQKLDPNKFGVLVHCAECGHTKNPLGRSAPIGMYMCDSDCPGYRKEPYAGQLWPEESEADFGYLVGNDGTEIRG